MLMDPDDAEDIFLIERLHLQGPRPGPNRVMAGSNPDAVLHGSSSGPAVASGNPVIASRSLPKMSGSMQTQFVHRQVPGPHRRPHRTISADEVAHRVHRERLSTTDANTRIFGDNREARRIRRIHEVGIQPLEFPEDDGGIQLAIFLPYMEPVLYFSWLFPLNLNAYRMLEQIPFFFEEDDLIIQTLLSVTSSSFILSLVLDPLPAINYLEFFRHHSLTTQFYNHHLAAYEGLIVSHLVDSILSYKSVSAKVRLTSLLGTFFLTFISRHVQRRSRGVQSLTFEIGEYLLMIMVY